MIMHVINGGSRKFIVLRSVLVVVLWVLSCHIFAERTIGCCVTDVDMWVGKTAIDAANKQVTPIYICKGGDRLLLCGMYGRSRSGMQADRVEVRFR